jgi:alpha-acetolactate decarboxylase
MIEIKYTEAQREAALNREVGSFELIQDGTYECVVDSIVQRTNKSNAPMIEVYYKIREDVAQNHKGSKIGNWFSADKEKRKFDPDRMREFCICHNIENGMKFENMEGMLKYISEQKLVVKMKVREVDEMKDGMATGNKVKRSSIVKINPSTLATNLISNQGDDDLPF